MNIVQRGNPGILKKIQEEAKKVSISNGINKESPKPVIREGGAYNSIRSQYQPNFTNNYTVLSNDTVKKDEKPVSSVEYTFNIDYFKSIEDSIHTLNFTKEYYNAVHALFTLYSVDKLSDNVLRSLRDEDLNEIKSIVKEFMNLLNSY